jgi:feruloyl-CoA synthase
MFNAESAPVRGVALGGRSVYREVRSDGTAVFVNREPLGDYPASMIAVLEEQARRIPDRLFLAQREGDAWRTTTYAEVLVSIRAVGQALLDRGVSAQRPVIILSENSIEHAIIGMACEYIGAPYVPASAAYSLLATDFARLHDIVRIIEPGLFFAEDDARFGRALDAVVPSGADVVLTRVQSTRSASSFAELLATTPGSALDVARSAVGPDTIAKILFTSGSTGMPKGVITTQRMLCANQQMGRQAYAFVQETPPIIVDWLPWSHTFGGNHNFNMVLYNGGSLYINDGKPTRDGIGTTVRNLCEIGPTIHFDVPKGYEMLIEALGADAEGARRFFARIQMLSYAGAALSPTVWDALRELAVATTGERIFTSTATGSTETSPLVQTATWQAEESGNVGVPVAGVEMKLVPVGDKLEVRYRGPNITPGYWQQPDLTAKAFDDEGFYLIGDALRYVDVNDPSAGFFFDGRIAEDFKLNTGTWVSSGPLRLHVLAHFGSLLLDVVISGENRNEIGVLAIPNRAPCDALGEHLRAELARRLSELAATSTGSSNRVSRLLLLDDPPSLATGEATDKGSINARAVLRNRAHLVMELHAASPEAPVIVV